MARFYKIQIGELFLSSDGTANGDLCKLSVSGIAGLRKQIVKTVTPNADGSSTTQVFDNTENKPLEIAVISLPKAVGDSLVNLYNSLATFTVTGTDGDTGNFSVVCEMIDFDFKDFAFGFWKNAVIKLQTV